MQNVEHRTEIVLSRRDGKRFGFGNLLLILLLTGLIMVLSSVVDFSKPLPPWRLPAAGAIVGLILVMSGFRVGKISKQAMMVLFFWSGYATMSEVSAIINNDNITGELWQLLGVPLAIFFSIPHYAKRNGILFVAMAIVFGLAPFLVASLSMYPLRANYAGVYANPNAIGMMAVTWLAGLLILIRGHTGSRSGNLAKAGFFLLSRLSVAMALVVLVASSSRTSLVTAGILILIFVWTLLLDVSRKKFWITLVVTGISLLLLFTLVTTKTYQSQVFNEQLKKFESGLGPISGRELIWRNVIENASILGHGGTSLVRRVGEPAHNTYMEILDGRGLLGLLFRICFDIAAIALTYKLAVRRLREDRYAFGPFLVVTNYMVMGLSENVNGTLGSGIHMAFLLMIGMAINYDQYHEEAKNEGFVRS